MALSKNSKTSVFKNLRYLSLKSVFYVSNWHKGKLEKLDVENLRSFEIQIFILLIEENSINLMMFGNLRFLEFHFLHLALGKTQKVDVKKSDREKNEF